MSRFDDGDGEGMPWGLWEQTVSTALGGKRGQMALADLESALVALPEPRLIEGHLASHGAVCAVGAYVAHRKATEQGVPIAEVISAMAPAAKCWCGHSGNEHTPACAGKRWNDAPCSCEEFEEADDEEDIYETAAAGTNAGLSHTIAWHLAYLNDEQFAAATPEQRYEKVLGWVRRAQGKEVAA